MDMFYYPSMINSNILLAVVFMAAAIVLFLKGIEHSNHKFNIIGFVFLTISVIYTYSYLHH